MLELVLHKICKFQCAIPPSPISPYFRQMKTENAPYQNVSMYNYQIQNLQTIGHHTKQTIRKESEQISLGFIMIRICFITKNRRNHLD